jgi:hypothetical protein
MLSFFRLLLGAIVAGIGLYAGGSPASATTCVLTSGFTCNFQFTNGGSIQADVPFGGVSVTQTGSSLEFLVSVSPYFSITAGNAHSAFDFAIGNPAGVRTDNLGTIDPNSIIKTGGTGQFRIDDDGTTFDDPNSPFKGFNYSIDCTPNGAAQNCGQRSSLRSTIPHRERWSRRTIPRSGSLPISVFLIRAAAAAPKPALSGQDS